MKKPSATAKKNSTSLVFKPLVSATKKQASKKAATKKVKTMEAPQDPWISDSTPSWIKTQSSETPKHQNTDTLTHRNSDTPTHRSSDTLMHIGEAAKYLKISIDTLRRWEKTGKITPTRTPGGTRLYSKEALEAFKFGSKSTNHTVALDKVLSISAAAKNLGVSTKTLRRWDQAGKLVASRNQDGERVYKEVDLATFTSSNKPEEEARRHLDVRQGDALLSSPVSSSEPEIITIGTYQISQTIPNYIRKAGFFVAGLAVITLLITAFLVTGYSVNPQGTKQIFGQASESQKIGESKNQQDQKISMSAVAAIRQNQQVLGASTSKPSFIASLLQPFDNLAQSIITNFAPAKAKDLGFHKNSDDQRFNLDETAIIEVDDKTIANRKELAQQIKQSDRKIDNVNANLTEISTSLPQGIAYVDFIGKTIIDSYGNVYPSNSGLAPPVKPTIGTTTNPYYGLYLHRFSVDNGGNLKVLGQTTLGESGDDYVKIVGRLSNDLIPEANGVESLGDGDHYWKNAYINNITGATAGYATLMVSSVLNLPDGTAASPALTFTNDPDSGLYRLSANTIALTTNGTAGNGITINSSGNLGIGTTSPAYTLDVSKNVSGSTYLARFNNTNPDGDLNILFDNQSTHATALVNAVDGTKEFAIYTQPSPAKTSFLTYPNGGPARFSMTIEEGGNVGIGTTSPIAPLHVESTYTNPSVANLYNIYGKVTVTSGYNGSPYPAAKGGYFESDFTGTNTQRTMMGSDSRVYNTSSGTITYTYGATGALYNQSTGTFTNGFGTFGLISNVTGATLTTGAGAYGSIINSGTTSTGYGVEGYLINSSGGTWTTASALYGNVSNSGASTITTLRGLDLSGWSNSGTVNTSYGIYMDNSIDVGATKYALYSSSASNSYLAGNVGIGTTSPDYLLTIQKDNQDMVSWRNSTYELGRLGYVGVDAVDAGWIGLYSSGNKTININASGSSYFNNGNVGIGTTSPTYKLDVAGTARLGATTVTGAISASTGSLDIGSAGVKFGTIYADTVNATSLVGTVVGGQTDSADWTINADNVSADTEPMNLIFERGTETPNAILGWDIGKQFTLNSGLSITNGIGSGNVGIGTTSPASLLDVMGTAKLTQLDFRNAGATLDTSGNNLRFVNTGIDDRAAIDITNGNMYVKGNLGIGVSTMPTQAGLAVMSGNVGIGTTAPSQALDVVGNQSLSGKLALGGSSIDSNTYSNLNLTIAPSAVTYGYLANLTTTTAKNIYPGTFIANNNSSSGAISWQPGIAVQSNNNDAGTITGALGGDIRVQNTSSGTIATAYGLYLPIFNTSNGNITTAYGIWSKIRSGSSASGTISSASLYYGTGEVGNASGTIGTLYGLNLSGWSNSGTVNTSYGIYMDNSIDVGATKYALYSSSASNSYFAGNIGVGTTSPSQLLNVYSPNQGAIASIETAQANEYAELYLVSNGDMWSISHESNNNRLGIYEGSDERLSIKDGGNVGIGTTNPGVKLEVASSLGTLTSPSSVTNFRVRNDGSTSNNAGISIVSGNAASSYLLMGDNENDDIGFIEYNNTNNWMAFTTNGSEKLRINSAGNVGIGTTSPSTLLDVNGTSTFRGASTYNGNLTLNYSGTAVVGSPSTAYNSYALNLSSNEWNSATGNETKTAVIQMRPRTVNVNPTVATLSFDVGSATNILNLQDNGNVGIGTTAPATLFDINSKFNVLSSGNVGINKVTPGGTAASAKLHIVGDNVTNNAVLIAQQGVGTTYTNYRNGLLVGMGGDTNNHDVAIWSDGSSLGFIQSVQLSNSFKPLALNPNGGTVGVGYANPGTTAALAVNGNLGIGTTAPNYLLSVSNGATDYFTVDSTSATYNVPTSFTSSGDVSMAYDLNFTNPTASNIKSQAPLSITAGETFNSSDLSLNTYNAGSVNITQNNQPTASGTAYALQVLPNLTSSTNSLTYTAQYGTYSVPTVNLSGTSGTVTSLYNNYQGLTASAGTVTNWYGYYVAAPTGAGTVTNKYAFVSESGTGNVGIGTTAPEDLLSIVQPSAAYLSEIVRIANNNGSGSEELRLGVDTTGLFSFIQSTHQGTGQTPLILNGAGGNVGIGTTNPAYKFSVVAGTNANVYIGQDTINRGLLFFTDAANNEQYADLRAYDFTFKTNNLNRMFISQSGNVGIGTTSPQYLLDIGSGGAGYEVHINDDLKVEDLSQAGRMYTPGSLIIGDATTYQGATQPTYGALIQGNVGIGTTSPQSSLQVYGSTEGKGITVGGISTWADADILRMYSDGDTTSYIKRVEDSGDANGGYGLIRFETNANNAAYNGLGGFNFGKTSGPDYLRITNMGNVGIGTTNPVSLTNIFGNSSSNTSLLYLDQNSTGDAAMNFRIVGTTGWRMGIDNSDSDKFKISSSTLSDDFGTDYLTITTSGNIGIGTTNPSQLLHLNNGNLYVNGGTIGLSTTPDSAKQLYVDHTYSNTSGTEYGIFSNTRADFGGTAATTSVFGTHGQVILGANQLADSTSGDVAGGLFQVTHLGQATQGAAKALEAVVRVGYPGAGNAANILTNGYGLYVQSPNVDSAHSSSLVNAYGLFLEAQKATGVSTGYGIYQAGASDISYFAGNVGIGTTAPGNFSGLSFTGPILDVNGPIQTRTGTLNIGGSTYRKAAISTPTADAADPYLSFYVVPSGSSSTANEDMRIDKTGNIYLANINSSLGSATLFAGNAGNVGIGTTSPVQKLEVNGDFRLWRDGLNNMGLQVGFNNTNNITNMSFRDRTDTNYQDVFMEGKSWTFRYNGNSTAGLSIASTGAVSMNLRTTANTYALCHATNGPAMEEITDCNGSATDLAENYGTTDSSIEAGDLVIATGQAKVVADPHEGKPTSKAYMAKSSQPYQSNILGIISTNPNQLYGDDIFDPSENPRPVSLAGRVSLKVSTENGPIQTGDYITSSSISGVGMKATRPGQVVGKALQDYSGTGIGKILVLVNVTFADPSDILANLTLDTDGSLIVPKLKAGTLEIDGPATVNGSLQVADSSLNSSDLTSSGTPAAASSATPNYIEVASTLKTFDNQLATQSAQLASVTAQADVLSAQVASTSAQIASTSAQLASNSAQLASTSAQLAKVQSDVDSLKLTPPDTLLATTSAQLVDLKVTSDATISGKLEAYDTEIQNSFKSFGETTLGNTTIAGDLTQDGTLSITSGNTINSLGTLYLQSSPLADTVDFFNGQVTIDKTGRIVATEVVAKTVTTEKLNIANPVSGAEHIGTATIPAGATEIPVNTTATTANSKVFLTATSSTGGQALIVSYQEAGLGFIVSLDHTYASDIKFNWWIVDSSQ